MDIIKYIGSIGGVGAVFGLLFFYAFRKTVDQMREDRKFMEDRLTSLLNENFSIRERETKTFDEHTKVTAELFTWLKMRNGSK